MDVSLHVVFVRTFATGSKALRKFDMVLNGLYFFFENCASSLPMLLTLDKVRFELFTGEDLFYFEHQPWRHVPDQCLNSGTLGWVLFKAAFQECMVWLLHTPDILCDVYTVFALFVPRQFLCVLCPIYFTADHAVK